MSESKHHIKWEHIGLAGLAGLIVVGFLITVVVMIRSSRTPAIVVSSEEEAVEMILPQTTNRAVTPRVIRQYNRPLAVHSLDAWSSSAVVQPEAAAGNREDGVKDLRDRDDTPAKAFAVDVIADLRAPTQPSRQGQPRERKGFLDDDTEEKNSGWGWLADTITGDGKSKKDGADEQSDDDDKERADDESGDQRNTAAKAPSSSQDGKPVYFMDAAFDRSAKTDDKNRPATSASVKEARGDDVATEASREEVVAAAEEDGSGGNAFAAMLERDPFSSASYDRETESRWGADANADDRSRAADRETAAAAAAGAGMFSVVADAGASGGSGWWSGNGSGSASPAYGSDAYFNSGGGYNPASLGAVDAGGYGAVGGAVEEGGAFSPAAMSSGAGSAPLSGGSAFSMPAAGGSSFGSGRTLEEPVRPVTLPW